MAGPALVVALEKMVPSPRPGGPGRVVDPSEFKFINPPPGTEEGRVFSKQPSGGSSAGEDGRVAGPQNRALPPNKIDRHFNAGGDNPDESSSGGEDGKVVESEADYDYDDESTNMRAFGEVLNRTESGIWDDPTAAASNAMHFHYDPSEKEYHFTATAGDGSPLLSVYRKGNGKMYTMMKSMGGENNQGLLGHPVGTSWSGPAIRNQMKRVWKETMEPLRKAANGEEAGETGPDDEEAEKNSKKPMKKKLARANVKNNVAQPDKD